MFLRGKRSSSERKWLFAACLVERQDKEDALKLKMPKYNTQSQIVTLPRLSANKLGEMMTSSDVRKRTILVDARFPKGFKQSRHNAFQKCLRDFCASKLADPVIFASRRDELANEWSLHVPKEQKWRNDNIRLNKQALENLYELWPDFEFEGLTFASPNFVEQSLMLKGVKVSVRPDLIVRGMRKNKNVIGAVKFHHSKSHALNQESGELVATMLREYMSTVSIESENVETSLCISVDLPTKSIFQAPKAYKTRLKNVEAACEMVAWSWASIPQP